MQLLGRSDTIKDKMMKYVLLLLLLMMLMLTSCHFDYGEINIAETLDNSQPDIILENAELVFVRGTKVTISAEKVEIYSEQQQQSMFNVVFKEEDKNKNVRMEGRADQVAIETNHNNVTMIGNIKARSNKDEAEISSEFLFWDDESKAIEGSVVAPVVIQKDIGSTISGYGFRGDAKKRELLITGKTIGELVVEEENE